MRSLIEFERRHHRLLAWHLFLLRFARNLAIAIAIVAAALGLGMLGYAQIEGLDPLDAFLNAAMILSGMGPVAVMTTGAGKLFAGLYALLSGIVVVGATGIVLAPVLHRVLHHLHCDDRGEQ